jgi:hypothetical protein
MNDRLHIDLAELIDEITRYLAAVDVFRALKCGPTWLPEYAALPLEPDGQLGSPVATSHAD